MIGRALLGAYLVAFFGFLLGPVAILALTAFNAPSYPQALPIESLTLHWFAVLAHDPDLTYGLANSVRIGLLVVLVSVPCGLAAAMVMQQVYYRARPLYYLVAVAPVLTPGIIIGIATVIFWRDVTLLTGLRFIYQGVVLTVLGQSSFITAYCMLVFLARLQRFDPALNEAGLDLGASRAQVFAHILLPFLRPAILSAAVIAFLASFENYNTTTFAILADKTLVTVLAGRVRQGMTPAISALGVAIIGVTVLAALLFEAGRRLQDRGRAHRLVEARIAQTRELATP